MGTLLTSGPLGAYRVPLAICLPSQVPVNVIAITLAIDQPWLAFKNENVFIIEAMPSIEGHDTDAQGIDYQIVQPESSEQAHRTPWFFIRSRNDFPI